MLFFGILFIMHAAKLQHIILLALFKPFIIINMISYHIINYLLLITILHNNFLTTLSLFSF